MEEAPELEFRLEHAGQGGVPAGEGHHGKVQGTQQLELHCDTSFSLGRDIWYRAGEEVKGNTERVSQAGSGRRSTD